MTDEEAAARLKARVDRFHAYVDTLSSIPPDVRGEEKAAPKSTRSQAAERPGHPVDATVASSMPLNGSGTSHTAGHAGQTQESEIAAAMFARVQAEIAELKTAVQREREQTRQLRETVTRAQPRPAAVVDSGVVRFSEDGVQYEVLPPGYSAPDRRSARRPPRVNPTPSVHSLDHARRSNVILSLCIILLLAGFCSLVAFLVVR